MDDELPCTQIIRPRGETKVYFILQVAVGNLLADSRVQIYQLSHLNMVYLLAFCFEVTNVRFRALQSSNLYHLSVFPRTPEAPKEATPIP